MIHRQLGWPQGTCPATSNTDGLGIGSGTEAKNASKSGLDHLAIKRIRALNRSGDPVWRTDT